MSLSKEEGKHQMYKPGSIPPVNQIKESMMKDKIKKTGIELISEERKRQVEVEGWTPTHDSQHDAGELAMAAICYAFPTNKIQIGDDPVFVNPVIVTIERIRFWPWEMKWWRPSPRNRVRELVKAGALIAAEIDRIQNNNL